MQVEFDGVASNRITVPVAPTAPGATSRSRKLAAPRKARRLQDGLRLYRASALLRRDDLRKPPLVPLFAAELSFEIGLHDLFRQLNPDDAAAQAKHV